MKKIIKSFLVLSIRRRFIFTEVRVESHLFPLLSTISHIYTAYRHIDIDMAFDVFCFGISTHL